MRVSKLRLISNVSFSLRKNFATRVSKPLYFSSKDTEAPVPVDEIPDFCEPIINIADVNVNRDLDLIDLEPEKVGVVHVGYSNFHRAHQAGVLNFSNRIAHTLNFFIFFQ